MKYLIVTLAALVIAVSIAWAADEISASTTLQLSNTSVDWSRNISINADQATVGMQQSVQSIGTTAEALDKGNITEPGWMWAQNIGTNLIKVGVDVSGQNVFFIALEEDEIFMGPLATGASNIMAIASNAATLIEYVILEE